MTILFDTLRALEKPKAPGIPESHAHAMVETLHDVADTAQLATRGDLIDMGIGLKHDIEGLRAEVKHDINALRAETKFDLASLEHRLTIRLGVMMAAMVSAVAAMSHYLH